MYPPHCTPRFRDIESSFMYSLFCIGVICSILLWYSWISFSSCKRINQVQQVLVVQALQPLLLRNSRPRFNARAPPYLINHTAGPFFVGFASCEAHLVARLPCSSFKCCIPYPLFFVLCCHFHLWVPHCGITILTHFVCSHLNRYGRAALQSQFTRATRVMTESLIPLVCFTSFAFLLLGVSFIVNPELRLDTLKQQRVSNLNKFRLVLIVFLFLRTQSKLDIQLNQ